MVCNFNSGGSNALIWPSRVLHAWGTLPCRQDIHTHKIRLNQGDDVLQNRGWEEAKKKKKSDLFCHGLVYFTNSGKLMKSSLKSPLVVSGIIKIVRHLHYGLKFLQQTSNSCVCTCMWSTGMHNMLATWIYNTLYFCLFIYFFIEGTFFSISQEDQRYKIPCIYENS